MKTFSIRALKIAAAFSAAAITLAHAENEQDCAKVIAEVRAATVKSPQKVLVIVEDAIVANEMCAGEIVKAAILASHANADLVKQIVITATNISPRQSALIAESAAAATPENTVAVAEATKEATGMQPGMQLATDQVDGKQGGGKQGTGVVIPPSEVNDYGGAPLDIRGVYLIQPSTGATVASTNTKKDCGCVDTQDHGKNKDTTMLVVVHHKPNASATPQSPSYAGGP